MTRENQQDKNHYYYCKKEAIFCGLLLFVCTFMF